MSQRCTHQNQIRDLPPRTPQGCEECLNMGDTWVHLRLCRICGHVGCCDSSKYKHATKHYHEDNHPIMASLEAGDNWAWCYTDERFVPLRQHIGKYRPAKIELVEQEAS